jgi:hypothetical protein
VVLVKKEDFEACTQRDVIDIYFNGPTIVDLTETGDYYYYSGIGKHCEAGQKFHINVVKGEGSSGVPFPFKVSHAAPIPS